MLWGTAQFVEAGDQTELSPVHQLVCLACGIPIEEPLSFLAPLRCNECRLLNRPLDESLLSFTDDV